MAEQVQLIQSELEYVSMSMSWDKMLGTMALALVEGVAGLLVQAEVRPAVGLWECVGPVILSFHTVA